MQKSHARFLAGQRVVVRDEHWTVLSIEHFDAASRIELRGVDRHNRDQLQTVLTPFDCLNRTRTATRLRVRSRRATLAAAARAIAEAARWDESGTAAHADIELRTWQLAPAKAALRGATRILLADAVGLGKTIQAGVIISEVMARALAERVLVLTPAALREQWAGELRERFRLAPAILDQAALARMSATLPPDVNPWSTARLIVSSIDLVKRPEIRAALAGIPIDLLVVDEAHHLKPATDRGAVAVDLAERATWVVLATATPHSGDEHAFAFLNSIGDVGNDRWRVFRRTTADTQPAGRRRSRILAVVPTAAEHALFVATQQYMRALAAQRRTAGPRLVASVIARRVASSPHAAVRTLSRRLALLHGTAAPVTEPVLPWDDVDALDDDVTDAVLAMRGLDDAAEEARLLQRLLELGRAAASPSSKHDVICRLLRRTREQLLIFSEYRDVALHTAATVAHLSTVTTLHGGMSARERAAAVDAFNSGAVRTLVATDAAGEGLNLHPRCRFVVNLEVPWTPLRLEQRIGRVDRIGQQRRVHALHLVHRDSYEGTVITRLERRRERLRKIGLAACARDGVASEALLRRLRAMAGHGGVAGGGTICGAGRSRSAVLLFSVPLLDSLHRLVQREIIALRVQMQTRTRLSRGLVRRLSTDARVRASVKEESQRRLNTAESIGVEAARQLDARLSAILVRLARHPSSTRWQGSLFDRRAEQQAQRRAIDAAALTAHVQRRLQDARALRAIAQGEPELVAAWPIVDIS